MPRRVDSRATSARRAGGCAALGACLFALAGSSAARADQLDVCIAAAEEGQRLRIDGKLVSAREKLLECSQDWCASVVRADCTKWLSDVDSLMPALVIRAVDSRGADVVDVRVFVDGRLIASRLDGKEIQLDPGEHVFRFVLGGRAPGPTPAPIEQHILVRQGEQHRVLSVVFPALPAGASPEQRRSTGGETAAVSAPGGESHAAIPPAWSIGTIVAGGVALGVASYLWISGLADHSNLVSTCGPSHNCSHSAVDSAHGKLVAGDVVGGVGIGLVAIGVGTLVFTVSVSRPAQTSALRYAPESVLFGVSGRL
jgi:hypothetical protein